MIIEEIKQIQRDWYDDISKTVLDEKLSEVINKVNMLIRQYNKQNSTNV